MGYCSAITAKRVGKAVAFAIGMGFVVLQGLAYQGFVDVNWKQVEKKVVEAVDRVSRIFCRDDSPTCKCLYNHTLMQMSYL